MTGREPLRAGAPSPLPRGRACQHVQLNGSYSRFGPDRSAHKQDDATHRVTRHRDRSSETASLNQRQSSEIRPQTRDGGRARASWVCVCPCVARVVVRQGMYAELNSIQSTTVLGGRGSRTCGHLNVLLYASSAARTGPHSSQFVHAPSATRQKLAQKAVLPRTGGRERGATQQQSATPRPASCSS